MGIFVMVGNGSAAAVLVVAALLAATSPASAEGAHVVWARIKTPVTEMQIDFNGCYIASRTVRFKYDAPPIASPWAVLIPENLGHERTDYFKTCMLEHGYHAIPLTTAEAVALAAIKSPDIAESWLEQFYGRPEFQHRLAGASPLPLPEANNEPLAYGAVRFNPAELTAAVGVVKVGGVILSGKVGHRRTGRLAVGTTVRPDGFHTNIAAGTILHQAVFRDEDDSDKTYWCGAFRTMIGSMDDICARNGPSGYVLFHPSGGAHWIATGIDTHGVHAFADRDSFDLVESPTDLVGEIGFALAVRRINKTSIVLEAVVNRGADFETLWKKALPLDGERRAILPFWTHRLVITTTGDGMTVAFLPDGDGRGWPYQNMDN
jgi:hypothetical protein